MYRHTVLELIVNVFVFLRPTQICPQTMLSGAIMWCFLFLYFSSCLSSLLVDWWSLATAPRFVPLPSVPDFLKVFISISYCSTCFSFIFSTLFYSLWNLTNILSRAFLFTCLSLPDVSLFVAYKLKHNEERVCPSLSQLNTFYLLITFLFIYL